MSRSWPPRSGLGLGAVLCTLAGIPSLTLGGMLDTPLPTFSDGKAAQRVGLVPTVVKNNNLETVFICTNLDSVPIHIGVEVFDKTGALGNSIAAGNGELLNVGVGATVTIGTSGTALLTEDETITTLPNLRNGSGRIVATSPRVACIAMLVDERHEIEDPALSSDSPPSLVVAPVWSCGNSVVDPFEECDDGNAVSGDGCDATCQTEAGAGCAPTPESGCRLAAPGRALVKITDKGGPKDRFRWKWSRGDATEVADFQDPVNGSSSYRVCIYDSSQQSQPLAGMDVPAGGTCDGKPCWKASSSGFNYRNKSISSKGIKKIGLKAGVAGMARILVKGKGSNLPLPALPLSLPMTIQLVVDDGAGTLECWETTFTSVSRNDSVQFKAKGP